MLILTININSLGSFKVQKLWLKVLYFNKNLIWESIQKYLETITNTLTNILMWQILKQIKFLCLA